MHRPFTHRTGADTGGDGTIIDNVIAGFGDPRTSDDECEAYFADTMLRDNVPTWNSGFSCIAEWVRWDSFQRVVEPTRNTRCAEYVYP